MHQLAHVRGVVRHTPALLTLAAQFGQGPGAQARGLHVGAVQHHLLQCRPSLPVQPRRPARARSVVQSDQTLGGVAHHGIAQRLPLQARQPCSLSPWQTLERARDRLQARRSRPVLLPASQPPQFFRRQVRADCQRPSTHLRPPPTGLDATRITSARVDSNHLRVRKFAGRYQFATGFVRPAVDETCGRLAGSVGGEVGFVMVRSSPRISWTRDA